MSDSKVGLKGDPVPAAKNNKNKKKKAFLASISLDNGPAKTSPSQNSNVNKSGNKTQTNTATNPLGGVDPSELQAFEVGPKKTKPLHGIKANLPIGKNTTQLPKGYSNSAPMNPTEFPATGFTFPETVSRIFTTIPAYCEGDTLEDNPDGWCEVMLDNPHLKRVIYTACSDFPLPIPRPPKPLQCVKPSGAAGMGMFATADLNVNNLILAERPLLITPSGYPCRMEVAQDESLTYEQKALICLQDQEISLQCSIDRMLPETRAAYMSLANSHLEDGSGPLVGISRTNSFGITFEEGGDRHSTIYDKLSRINHSCLPNAAVKFNRKTFAGELHALRPIKAGEEIYISYCIVEDPRAERQSDLERYGFTCSCELCSSPDLEEFRQRMVFSVRKLDPFLDHKKIDNISKEELEFAAKESAEWVLQIEERNFHKAVAFRKHLQVVAFCRSKLGDVDESIRWTTLWFMIEQALNGADGAKKSMYTLALMAPLTLGTIRSRHGM